MYEEKKKEKIEIAQIVAEYNALKKLKKKRRPQKVAEYTAWYRVRKIYIFLYSKIYERPPNVAEYTACC